MNPNNQPIRLTTLQEYHAKLARHALESEPLPAFSIILPAALQIENLDSPIGQRNWSVLFMPDNSSPVQIFNGRNWENFPR